MKVVGRPEGFTVGREGFFWYDYFNFCAKCNAMIAKSLIQDGNCPFCNGKLRTRPRRSMSNGKFREVHCERIEV